MPAFTKRMRGFTIIELMATIVIAAILLAIALPNYRELTVRSNVTQLNNELITALNTARTEAVRRGLPVEVASISTGSTWNTGWNVLIDTSRNSTFSTGMANHAAIPTKYSVCAKSSGGGNDGRVIFTALGTLGGGATSFDINVNRPDSQPALSQRVTVSSSGMISARTGASLPAALSCP